MTLLTKLFQRFFGLGEADTAEMRRSENDLKEVLDYYDQVLASQQYLTRSVSQPRATSEDSADATHPTESITG